ATTTTPITVQMQVARLRVGEWGPCNPPPHNTLGVLVKESTETELLPSVVGGNNDNMDDNNINFDHMSSETQVEDFAISEDVDKSDLETMAEMPSHRIARDLEAISSAVAEADVVLEDDVDLDDAPIGDAGQGFLGEMPLVGSQERHLSCVHANGSLAAIQWCLAGMESGAARVRTCVVARDCLVTQWSEWTTVVPGCVAPSGQV
ncbi:unnamed protein product, partial [Meganyctiphanes norvegica]